MFQFTPYLLPFVFSALSLFLLAILILKLPKNPSVYFMLAVLASVEVWIIGFIFEIASIKLETKIILANLQFIGINSLPIAWLGLTLSYFGDFKRLKRWLPFTLLIPLLDQIMIWTDPLHHLFRTNPELDLNSAPFPILVNDYSYWYYFIQIFFVNTIFVVTFLLLNYKLRFAFGPHKKQILFLMLSTIFPVGLNVLYVLKLSPVPNLNLSAIGFTFSSLLLSWSLIHYDFLDLMPVARNFLVDTLKDAWLVIDYAWRFVDLNQAALNIIGQQKADIIGQPIEEVLSNKPKLVAYLKAETELQSDIYVEEGVEPLYFDLSLNPLYAAKGKLGGRLVILRDITRHVKAEQERESLIRELQEALIQVKVLSGMLPICSSCKNIRDDRGYWHRVEMYLEDHSDLKFSHGICPGCLKKLYPEIAEEVLNKLKAKSL